MPNSAEDCLAFSGYLKFAGRIYKILKREFGLIIWTQIVVFFLFLLIFRTLFLEIISETCLLSQPCIFYQVMPLKVVQLRVKAHQKRTSVPCIRNKEYSPVIWVLQSIMVAKTSILSRRILRALELTLWWVHIGYYTNHKSLNYKIKDQLSCSGMFYIQNIRLWILFMDNTIK